MKLENASEVMDELAKLSRNSLEHNEMGLQMEYKKARRNVQGNWDPADESVNIILKDSAADRDWLDIELGVNDEGDPNARILSAAIDAINAYRAQRGASSLKISDLLDRGKLLNNFPQVVENQQTLDKLATTAEKFKLKLRSNQTPNPPFEPTDRHQKLIQLINDLTRFMNTLNDLSNELKNTSKSYRFDDNSVKRHLLRCMWIPMSWNT